MVCIPRSWGDVENNKNEKREGAEREIGNRQPIQLVGLHIMFFFK